MTRYKYLGIVCTFAQAFLIALNLSAETPADTAKARSHPGSESAASTPSPATLVREVVYNELHDHDAHGYWRYWIEKHQGRDSSVQEQIESTDGPVARIVTTNGQPVSSAVSAEEDRRLTHLLESPSEQAEHRKAYAEDEHRIGRILALLPDAFLYQPDGDQRLDGVLCHHLSFVPNPAYPAHSIEARIFHAMSGELWIGADSKRLVRLDGQLQENVDFGYGILGRLYKGGWFRLERTEVGANGGFGDWKTHRLEVHMQGRAILFKTIARETSEVRGGFSPVPRLTLQQAVGMARSESHIAANNPHGESAALRHP